MRSNRDLQLVVLLALACAAGTAVLRAQESPPAAPPVAAPSGAGEPAVEAAPEEEAIQFPDAPDPGATPTRPATTGNVPAGSPAASPAPATTAPAEEGEDEPPPDPAPRTPGVVGPTPGHFEPTEKVRADFDVSFPVDI